MQNGIFALIIISAYHRIDKISIFFEGNHCLDSTGMYQEGPAVLTDRFITLLGRDIGTDRGDEA